MVRYNERIGCTAGGKVGCGDDVTLDGSIGGDSGVIYVGELSLLEVWLKRK